MNIPDKAVEAAARAIARAADADYWVDEIAEWEAQDEWEKGHYAEANYPSMAYEDRDDYMAQGRAALKAAAPFIAAQALRDQATALTHAADTDEAMDLFPGLYEAAEITRARADELEPS